MNETTGVVKTRYGLGARGVDLMGRTVGSTVTLGYPIYDAHGNNVATLSRTLYSIGDRRSYDAWGVVRAQQSGGDPKLRYCVNLGHRQDDESGLVYMRARYYEPTSGRFVSEDPGRAGGHWFSYCGGDPVNRSDRTGRMYENIAQELRETLEWCVKLVNNFNAGVEGYTDKAEVIDDLVLHMKDLEGDAQTAEYIGQELMRSGDVAEELAPYMGQMGLIQEKIGEIQQGLGAEGGAWGVAAQLGARCVQEMIYLLN